LESHGNLEVFVMNNKKREEKMKQVKNGTITTKPETSFDIFLERIGLTSGHGKGGKFWNFSSSEGYEPRKGKTEGCGSHH